MRSVRCFVSCSALLYFFAIPLVAKATEPWTDPRLPVSKGLVLWLDAARLSQAYQAGGKTPLLSDDPIAVWPDGTGHHRDVLQKETKSQPLYKPTGDFHAVRFPGNGVHLRRSGLGQALRDMTMFVVTAPFSNPEPFAGWLSMSEVGRNDYETGFNIDQGVGSPPAMQVVNIEGAGSIGMKNLLNQPVPYGSVVRMGITSTPGKDGTTLWINGKQHGSRDRGGNGPIQLVH